MKKYRRIEITAFRRSIIVMSGESSPAANQSAPECAGIWVNDADSLEAIESETDEGQRILIEAVRLLQEKISRHA